MGAIIRERPNRVEILAVRAHSGYFLENLSHKNLLIIKAIAINAMAILSCIFSKNASLDLPSSFFLPFCAHILSIAGLFYISLYFFEALREYPDRISQANAIAFNRAIRLL